MLFWSEFCVKNGDASKISIFPTVQQIKMDEIGPKISMALTIIEKFDGKLPDDTYLDKTISGLIEHLSKMDDEMETFLKNSQIEEFCSKYLLCRDKEYLQELYSYKQIFRNQ